MRPHHQPPPAGPAVEADPLAGRRPDGRRLSRLPDQPTGGRARLTTVEATAQRLKDLLEVEAREQAIALAAWPLAARSVVLKRGFPLI